MIIKFVWLCPYTHDKYFRIFERLFESKQLYKIKPTAFMTFEDLAIKAMHYNKENPEYFYYKLWNPDIPEINYFREVSNNFMEFIEEVKDED